MCQRTAQLLTIYYVFFRTILEVGHFYWGAWTQLHQTWRGHTAIIAALQMQVCFRVRIPYCIFKRRRLKVE